MEKSKMEKIRDWIETCSLLKGNKIKVDYLDDKMYSYSIDPTPQNPEVKAFTDGTGGKYQIVFDFTVQAPWGSTTIINLTNSKFCEDFQNWIRDQNRKKNFPDIDGAFSIKCTSPGYILQKVNTMAIYIIQMNFTYYEFL